MAATLSSGEASGERSREPALLERSAELATLGRCLDRARRGAGTAVMVCGSAGTGKSSLVQAFLASVAGPEAPLVLSGGCDDLIAPRPLGPFLDMIHSTGLLADELAADADREDLLVGLLRVLDRPTRPAMLVVEDAQWADDASIDVMRYLARRLVSLHALLVVTMRDGDIGGSHPARALLTGSSSSAPVRIDLGPLSLDAVDRLSRGSTIDARYVHEVSAGNPLLVHQLLAADPADATRLARETLVARAARLSPAGRAALQALAVLPDGADPTLARTLFADRPEALHEAEGTGLLLSSTSHIRFRHELGRTAVVEAMSFGERMAATDRALGALVATGDDPTVLVHIARAAGDGPRATRFAVDVLDRGLAPDDHQGSWALARIALECTVDLEAERVAGLHSTAARAGRAAGHHSEALRHAERAVQLRARTGTVGPPGAGAGAGGAPDRELASAWLDLADLHGDAGDHLRARTALRAARDLLGDGPSGPEWARCTTGLAAAAVLGGERGRAVELADAAVAAADRNGWTVELTRALGVRGRARGGPATGAGMADLTRAIEIGTVDEPSEHHAANLLDLAGAHADGAATAEAERLVDEAERYCREHGLDRLRFRARVQRAQVMLQRGRTAEAEDLATALADDATEPGAIKAAAEAILARILVRRGDERAGELVERAWSAAVATGEIDALAFAGVTRLEHLWVEGGGEGLPQFARYLLGLGDRHGHHRLRAEARRAVQRLDGDHGRAETNRAALPGCPGPLAAALDGDHLRAARGWEAAGEPYEQALELVESTEPSAAFEGLRLLDRVGATRIADLARQRLRLRGLPGVPRGPRRAPDGGVPVLTGRQIDVLRLVARGHTNAEIAQELYVARRTVDNHVSAILSRLGVEGRGRAVAEARSRGLIEH